MKAFNKIIINTLLLFLISGSLFAQPYVTTVQTVVIPPINANISQSVIASHVNCMLISPVNRPSRVQMRGTIKCTSPTQFTITLSSAFAPTPISLTSNVQQLTTPQILNAFGNFVPSNLQASGINISTITDANNNLKLPVGTYSLCLFADSVGTTFNFSNPNSGCGVFNIASSLISINTIVFPPVNPLINVDFASPAGANVMLSYNDLSTPFQQVKLFGAIQSLSANPLEISLNPNYQSQSPVTLTAGVPLQLSTSQILDAFGGFNPGNLIVSGNNFLQLREGNNIRIPDGNYKVCFYARYFSASGLGANASNTTLGCGNFTVCSKASAPQLTSPVSNFNFSSDTIPVLVPSSPLIFTWTTPNATCGVIAAIINYDFQINELFDGQTVSDAINNPYVFKKTHLNSPNFLLDSILYKDVLQRGKKYIVLVKAYPASFSTIQIDNNGYSRPEAFGYGEKIGYTWPLDSKY